MNTPSYRKTGDRGRSRAALLLVPVLVLSLGATACGSSSSSGGGTAGANAATKRTSSASVVSTVPVHIPSGPSGPPPKHRAAKFSPATQQALVKFANCMRAKGIHMPEPNISGPGAVFDPKQMDLKNPHFAAAAASCRAQFLTGTG